MVTFWTAKIEYLFETEKRNRNFFSFNLFLEGNGMLFNKTLKNKLWYKMESLQSGDCKAIP